MNLGSKARAVYRLQEYGNRPAIDGVEVRELRRFNDDGGSLIELLRMSTGVAEGIDGLELKQVNYSCVQPGAVKAFHVHRTQTDLWFVPPEDRVLLVLVDVREGSPTEHQQMDAIFDSGLRERAAERPQPVCRKRRALDAAQQRGAVTGVQVCEGVHVLAARLATEQRPSAPQVSAPSQKTSWLRSVHS